MHTADSHIGARQYGLEERRADFSKAFHQVIAIAIEEKVSAVIHAGDLFEDRNPSAEDLQDVFAALSRLKEAGIQLLGIVGNHEQRRNENLQWLDLFAELGLAVHLGQEPYQLNGISIYGLDYGGRRRIKLPHLMGGVLVAHQLIDKVSPTGELKFEDLSSCGAEVVLLGDYHEHKVWHEAVGVRHVLITYSGSTERWSLGEKARRGCNIIDLETHRLDRRELTTRRFVYISEDEDALKGIEAHKVQGAVVCVYLGDSQHTVEEIEEYGRSKGALAVRVIKGGSPQEPSEQELDISVEFGDLDVFVSERLDKMSLSETSRRIDAIVRDLEKIADSAVDSEVSKILEQSHGETRAQFIRSSEQEGVAQGRG